MVKNLQANGILEHVHQILRQMLHTAEIDMTDSVIPDDIDVFLDNATWAICSTYHIVLKASPGAAIFGWDMLFDIPFVADWHKIGEPRQSLTDRGNQRKNAQRIDYDQDHKLYFYLSYPHKIVHYFDSNTILASCMTTQIIAVIFSLSRFFFAQFSHLIASFVGV